MTTRFSSLSHPNLSLVGDLRIIGGAALNVFVDVETREQPTSKNGDYYLNEGAHQLSIYHELPELKPPFSTADFIPMKRFAPTVFL